MKTTKYSLSAITLALVLISFTTFAGNFEFSNKSKINSSFMDDKPAAVPKVGKDLVSGGFVLIFGVSQPTFSFREPYGNNYGNYYHNRNYVQNDKNKLGTQISLELGNHFLFYKMPDKFGIGMNFSWLTIGYSNYHKTFINYPDNYFDSINSPYYYSNRYIIATDEKFFNWDLNLIKLGPMGTIVAGPVAVDVMLDIVPVSLEIGGNKDFAYFQSGFFTNYAIGVRARWQVFTAGVDVNFGTHNHADPDVNGQYKTSFMNTKFVLGFRF